MAQYKRGNTHLSLLFVTSPVRKKMLLDLQHQMKTYSSVTGWVMTTLLVYCAVKVLQQQTLTVGGGGGGGGEDPSTHNSLPAVNPGYRQMDKAMDDFQPSGYTE
ncbi:uncharacterized protein V6R79_009092 [Siganus canaliculatus]